MKSAKKISKNDIILELFKETELIPRFKKMFMDLYSVIDPSVISLLESLFKDEASLNSIFMKVYYKYYTVEEIRGLIKFYKSGVGKKSIKMDECVKVEIGLMFKEWLESQINKGEIV